MLEGERRLSAGDDGGRKKQAARIPWSGTVAAMETRLLRAAEVDLYRQVRLDALRTDPEAFASTVEQESQFDDDTWASRLAGFAGRRGGIFVAESEGVPVGMAGVGFSERAGDTVLWGMWVRPGFRNHGTGRALVDAAIAWAVVEQATTITLWVVRTNTSGISLYEQCGFVATGDIQAHPSDPCAEELAMQRRLAPG
jgi:GNAT superfamily N-acetyltransferase